MTKVLLSAALADHCARFTVRHGVLRSRRVRRAASLESALALVFAFSGDKDETIKYLEASYRMHDPDLIFIQNEPLFDFLHSDPRYQAIVNKMGLTPAY